MSFGPWDDMAHMQIPGMLQDGFPPVLLLVGKKHEKTAMNIHEN